jgi:uncharacterized protein
MNRETAIAGIAVHAEAMRARGATSAYLFGSTARDEANATSDLDVFIDFDPHSGFSLLDLAGLHRILSDSLGVRVDLTTRSGLHPKLRTAIEREAIRIF